MTTFPGSPRLIKGALIGIDPFNPLASVVVFQYNPIRLGTSVKERLRRLAVDCSISIAIG